MGAGQCNEDVQKGLANLANLPLLFVHGEKDELIPSSCSQDTSDTLSGMHPRVAPQLRLLPDREHEITLQSDDGLTLAFLKDKVRDAFPKRVSLRLPDLAFHGSIGSRFWKRNPELAEVTAEIKTTNRIEIRSREVKKTPASSAAGDVPAARSGSRSRGMASGLRRPRSGRVRLRQSGAADPKLDLTDRKEFSLP